MKKIILTTVVGLFLLSGCSSSFITVNVDSNVTNTVTKHTNGIEATL